MRTSNRAGAYIANSLKGFGEMGGFKLIEP